MTCPLCRQRKAKRPCPALGHEICAVCCGTKRLREIACPPTCIYLDSAQKQPAAAVKRQQEQDLAVLMAALGRLNESQLQLFFLIQTVIARFRPDGLGRVVDADVAEAASARSPRVRDRESRRRIRTTGGVRHGKALRRELKAVFDRSGPRRGTRFEREAADVLRGVERGARHESGRHRQRPGRLSDAVARILQERPPTPRHHRCPAPERRRERLTAAVEARFGPRLLPHASCG